jgi:hypothetical protein
MEHSTAFFVSTAVIAGWTGLFRTRARNGASAVPAAGGG